MANESGGPQFELPIEQPNNQERPGEQSQDRAVERQRPATQEAGVGKRAPQPGSTAVPDITQIPQTPTVIPADLDGQSNAAPVSPATTDLKAGDGDLIEKDWVARTKSVAAQTQDDPHRQKDEMSKIKADYIHKRFKKIIKTDETAAA